MITHDAAGGRTRQRFRAALLLPALVALGATLTACGAPPNPGHPPVGRGLRATAAPPVASRVVPAPWAPIPPLTSASTPPPAPAPAAPVPVPVPVPVPMARVAYRNQLIGPGIDSAVVPYTDCYGNAAVPRLATVLVTCSPTRWYFAGHNPGLFTALMGYTVGEEITYWDGAGVPHTLRVVAIRDGLRATPWVPRARADVVAQFQTCETSHPEGGIDRFVDAVEV